MEVVGFGPPLAAESVSPLPVTTPLVEAPLTMVEHVQPAPVVEYVAPATAVTCAAPAPVVQFLAPAPAVTYAAPVPVLVEKIVEIPEIQTVHGSQNFERLGTGPDCQRKLLETEEVVEFGPPFVREEEAAPKPKKAKNGKR